MNSDCNVDGLTLDHYSTISTDRSYRIQAEDNCAICKSFHHGNNSLSHAGPSPTDSHWARCGPVMVFRRDAIA